ncbi:hypothetical protein [Paenibacillus sp. GCM10027626]|uniref:hypothetical protein n=1 Tax=Paenibacillus sp. GCM10027626 TaxID=3273411 RepID=UPI0036445001
MPSFEDTLNMFKTMFSGMSSDYENSLRDMATRMNQNASEGEQQIKKLKDMIRAPARMKLVIDAQSAIDKVQLHISSLAKQVDALNSKARSIKIKPLIDIAKEGVIQKAEAIRKQIQKQLIVATISTRLMMPEEGIRASLAKKAEAIRKQIQKQLIVATISARLMMPEGGFRASLAKAFEPVSNKWNTLMSKYRSFREKRKGEKISGASKAASKTEEAAEKAKAPFFGKIKDFAAKHVTVGSAKKLMNATVAPAMDQMQLEDTFKARTGDSKVGSAMFAKFKQDALAAGQDVNQTLKNTLSFMPMTKNTNQLGELNRLAQQMAVFDTSGNGLEKAANALQAAMSGDVGSLASSFNMSKADVEAANLGQFANAGDLDGFIQAFDQLLEKQQMGKEAFETMMATPAKQVETLQTNFNQAMADIGMAAAESLLPIITMLNEAFQEGKFDPFIQSLSDGLNWVAQAALGIYNAAMQVFAFFMENWSIIGPVVEAVAIAVGVLAFAIQVASIAQAIFNAVMDANPFVLIALLIIGVITALVALWQNNDAFAAALITVWNSILGFFDQIPIFFMWVGNGIVSAFLWAKVEALKLMEGLANGVIDAINWIIEKLNSLPFIEIQAIENVSWAAEAAVDAEAIRQANEQKLKNAQDEAAQKAAERDADLDRFIKERQQERDRKNADPTKQQKDIMNDWNKSLPKQDPNNKPPGSPGLSNASKLANPASNAAASNIGSVGNIGNVDKVNSVGGIDDTVDISSEDLKIMRDLAEVQSIQNFVSLTPQVNVTTGPIMKTIDEDEMINKIVAAAEREISEAAKGVYA